ncbi:MAG: hypothetical protein RTU92_04575, partial [Candidatus Thorarchaeota archaeon]
METKVKATFIIIIIVAAAVVGVFLMMNMGSGPPTPKDEPSSYFGEVWIGEIYTGDLVDVESEYFELYTTENLTHSSSSGWYVTTFDEEGMVPLPEITGLRGIEFIAVYTTTGINDVDGSDGNVTIF